MHIRMASTFDSSAIAAIILPVIRQGETYALDQDMNEMDAVAYWCDKDKATFVVEDDQEIIGTYYIRANQS
jgi:hypothetical protein